jgi:hypothetical protein
MNRAGCEGRASGPLSRRVDVAFRISVLLKWHQHKMEQLAIFDIAPGTRDLRKKQASSTFSGNVGLPIHRWFRYSAGFSALWVREVIEAQRAAGRERVFDPFAGSGTTLLEAERAGVAAIGTESHPFVARVARAKLLWRESPDAFLKYALRLLETARSMRPTAPERSPLLQRCFPAETLARLDSLKLAWQEVADLSPFSELAWLALISILRSCSPVGTAQWQYVLPNKTKANVAHPYNAFEQKAYSMTHDMRVAGHKKDAPVARLYQADVRGNSGLPKKWADFVITSPPYVNNYDYADATRLEMTFMGELEGWGDLQDAVRVHLVRSCTQHVAPITDTVESMIAHPHLQPIHASLRDVCSKLAIEREHHGGKKPYHALVAAYFLDMARVWKTLRSVTADKALVCFVVGDSAPYGVHVPVERWLGELALAAGFASYTFDKTRDRNIKWKNRKHRVPLLEGRLWVRS